LTVSGSGSMAISNVIAVDGLCCSVRVRIGLISKFHYTFHSPYFDVSNSVIQLPFVTLNTGITELQHVERKCRYTVKQVGYINCGSS